MNDNMTTGMDQKNSKSTSIITTFKNRFETTVFLQARYVYIEKIKSNDLANR
jgi:hypothetical protein